MVNSASILFVTECLKEEMVIIVTKKNDLIICTEKLAVDISINCKQKKRIFSGKNWTTW